MKKRELYNLGIGGDASMAAAIAAIQALAQAGEKKAGIRAAIAAVAAAPDAHVEAGGTLGELARAMVGHAQTQARFVPRDKPAPYKIWGSGLDDNALSQMDNACDLPISAAGALMPDAHMGYGLPIGGVLATRNAVIPYAVGMDIACRMKMTVLDMPPSAIRGEEGRLRNVLERETSFGIGACFKKRHDHAVMAADWSVSPITQRDRDKAWKQLGSSGSGNHFVEFGTLTLAEDELGLKAGVYTALLSHSGSRGTGGNIAQHYSKLAMAQHPELPRQLQHLAWFGLDEELGQEYWAAMELMGQYAAANHELIHRSIAKALSVKVLADVENHHNFAWKEHHFGEEVIVHRKGATPAGEGALGVLMGV